MDHKMEEVSRFPKMFLSGRILLRITTHTSLIPVLGRQWQADLCEFEASLIYIVYKS